MQTEFIVVSVLL